VYCAVNNDVLLIVEGGIFVVVEEVKEEEVGFESRITTRATIVATNISITMAIAIFFFDNFGLILTFYI
jgi:hypothetical protein